MDWSELAEGCPGDGDFRVKEDEITPTLEALPIAMQFLAKPPPVKQCKPGHFCERSARGLGGCVAGFCNPPMDGDGVPGTSNDQGEKR